jgi:uncharacterized Zn finger protein
LFYPLSEVRTFFRFCPACGRRFHIRLVNKRLVRDTKETRVLKERATSGINVGYRYQTPVPQVLDVDVPVTIEVADFEYAYKCGHCGHVWTEMHKQEAEVKTS